MDTHDISYHHPHLDVAIRSGDYFPTLATKLESISLAIERDHPEQAQAIYNLVAELEYLQPRYQITKKP